MPASAATIQVVDDDEAVRTALSRLLRALGHHVVCWASGAEFLAQPVAAGPGCVVLDLSMPGISGLEVQRRMQQAGDYRPVVFLTGAGDIPTSVNAMKAGAVDFLTKPVARSALLPVIAEALARSVAVQADVAIRAEVAALAATLTVREAEVMHLVVAGLPNKRIARDLGIAEKTVKIHRGRVMEKMQAESLADLVRRSQLLAPRLPTAGTSTG